MIPNIFVSSTIADLHYLRDALRDAVVDLAYRPIMSDYGEVGYLAASTAADSCYRSVAQCQMVVLIVGRRYGSVDNQGISVTHREFLTAREKGLPIVSFVEADVLSFKQVYDADPKAVLWDKFDRMDNPRATFKLLDEVRSSPTFNACIGFTSAGEAKRLLKLQIADFVGERLAEIVRPLKTEVQDVLAEVKVIRQELQSKAGASKEMDRYARILRFLLDDRSANFRKLLEQLFTDLDAAIPIVLRSASFEGIVTESNHKLEVNDDDSFHKGVFSGMPERERVKYGHSGMEGYYFITKDRCLIVSTPQLKYFENLVRAMNSRK
jgi:hypothetical protein